MNIFVLDENIEKCAKYHVDRHVVKQIVETCQMLCTAHYYFNTAIEIPYKKAYPNHPCTKWIRASKENYIWGVKLGLELCKEYTYRYNKVHKCEAIINWCRKNQPNIQNKLRTLFAQAMPDQYKCDNAVKAYREYYLKEKRHLFKWKNRPVPYWIGESNEAVL